MLWVDVRDNEFLAAVDMEFIWKSTKLFLSAQNIFIISYSFKYLDAIFNKKKNLAGENKLRAESVKRFCSVEELLRHNWVYHHFTQVL